MSDFREKERFTIPQCTVKGMSGLSHLFLISRVLEDFFIHPEKIIDYKNRIGEKIISEKIEEFVDALEKERRFGYQNMKKLLITKLQKN